MDNGENNVENSDINEPATSGYCSPAALELPDDVPRPNFRHDHGVYKSIHHHF